MGLASRTALSGGFRRFTPARFSLPFPGISLFCIVASRLFWRYFWTRRFSKIFVIFGRRYTTGRKIKTSHSNSTKTLLLKMKQNQICVTPLTLDSFCSMRRTRRRMLSLHLRPSWVYRALIILRMRAGMSFASKGRRSAHISYSRIPILLSIQRQSVNLIMSYQHTTQKLVQLIKTLY